MKQILILLLGLCALTACDDIDEAHRFSDHPVQVHAQRNVLVEDFTGQRCVNCPDAAKMLHLIQQLYGEDHVIGVAIHGGGFQLPIPLDNPFNLATQFGNDLQNEYGVESWPNGSVNGGTLIDYNQWSAAVVEQLQLPTPARLNLNDTHYVSTERQAYINVKVTAAHNATWQLNIWLTEDSIRGYQLTPEGVNKQYLHQHVLRTSLTPLKGESIRLSADVPTLVQKSFVLPEHWKPENIYAVAFVTDGKKVLQVMRTPLVPQPHSAK